MKAVFLRFLVVAKLDFFSTLDRYPECTAPHDNNSLTLKSLLFSIFMLVFVGSVHIGITSSFSVAIHWFLFITKSS